MLDCKLNITSSKYDCGNKIEILTLEEKENVSKEILRSKRIQEL